MSFAARLVDSWVITTGSVRMGKKHRKSAKKQPKGLAKLPPLGLPAIVAILHNDARSNEQEAQLAAHQKRVQQLLRECTGDMHRERSHGYLRDAMRDQGVLEEDLWIMLQDCRRDPELKRKLSALANRFKARAELRVVDSGGSPPATKGQTGRRAKERGGSKGSRKSKGVWLVQLGRGPKLKRRRSSR